MLTSTKIIRRNLYKLGLAAVMSWTLLAGGVTTATADVSLYSDALAAGWVNWSWSSSVNLAGTTKVHGGTSAISVTLDGWGALYLHADPAIDLSAYDMLSFWIYGGSSGTKLNIIANGGGTPYPLSAPANSWTHVYVPLSAFGNPSPATLKDLYWQDSSGSAQTVFYLDDISLHSRPVTPTSDLVIYADALGSGWQNWSWDATTNAATTAPVHGGTNSISTTLNKGWAALYLHSDNAVNLTGYDTLMFWINGGNSGNQHLDIVANGSAVHYPLTVPANSWTQVKIPLTDLGNPAILSDIYWMDNTGGAQSIFYIDDISLHASAGTPLPPVSGPALTIDAAASHHQISDDIYGMNSADEQLARELRLPVNRWGGNGTTRYNWQTGMLNTGNDWYFENLMNGTPDAARSLPNGSASDQFVEQNVRTGTRSLITVPLIGWTPKSGSPKAHPYDCGFKVTKYGPQQSVDQWDSDCGNGVKTDGTKITVNDPTDTSMSITTTFVTDWIQHLKQNYGTAAKGGVSYYALDNEPMLWNSTHRDVHPLPTTYDELRDKTYLYAPAIKAADPSAKIFGPVLWGWCAYLSSAADNCSQGSDFQAHGNTWFVAWYLQQMKLYEQQHGQRILDYLDLHGYPYANGVSLSTAGSPATQALRLRSTKDLWDATYNNEGWVADSVHLIPRMRGWVNDNYPGTKLAITEYNWGGLEHINGALAQADVLGIFGREGLDLATLWGPPSSTQPGAYAFRMYRNYDGAGHGFGDVGVLASSADQGKLAVYGALRSSDNALTVAVINKTADNAASTVNLAGFTPAASAAVYQYSAANLTAIQHLADQQVSTQGFSGTFPANSITLLVIPSAAIPANPVIAATKARIYLGNDDTFTVSNTGATVYGGPGADTVKIDAGVANVILDQNIERVIFSGKAGDYRFKQTGNKINVYDASGAALLVTLPVQGGGTQLSFTDGTATALLTAGVMTLGTVPLSITAVGTLSPALTANAPAPTTGTTARVYLGANDDTFTVGSNGTILYGGTGNDIVTIAAGVTGVTIDQNVERINFTGTASDYRFKQTGNKINVYDSIGVMLVTAPVQGDADGTVLGFKDGSASALLAAGVMTLGGATVSPTAAGVIVPILK